MYLQRRNVQRYVLLIQIGIMLFRIVINTYVNCHKENVVSIFFSKQYIVMASMRTEQFRFSPHIICSGMVSLRFRVCFMSHGSNNDGI